MTIDRQTALSQEKQFLDQVYTAYALDDSPQTKAMRELVVRTVAPYLKGGAGLELGCSDGYMTALLAQRLERLDVVDGSRHFIEAARQRNLPNVGYHHSLFEEYAPDFRYDYVFASFVLEHVLDPQPVLAMARAVLKEDGLLFVVVPNARALSRQLALHMG
ncbi:class I SAM-dependent methyltransferase [Methylogaea oryzae]|nr:class I SAM-dependent methyltransferase [Methylogaea oryzae]